MDSRWISEAAAVRFFDEQIHVLHDGRLASQVAGIGKLALLAGLYDVVALSSSLAL